ncbi:protein lethal(2)essential for life [Caerostris extrusa]|uniref:Protein lethal(2)essential for life n=1 Tax=Caerostris extrusa TaxID=172846 RepID=A0AAV4XC65_CAEEX|nr:protein lethal(2)essential for life [Caerostris extrusa]
MVGYVEGSYSDERRLSNGSESSQFLPNDSMLMSLDQEESGSLDEIDCAFRVTLNLSHFTPQEMDVKKDDNCIIIHAKHGDKIDEHGFVSREFTRRYRMPEDADMKKIKSFLNQDGILTIAVARKSTEPSKKERIVPITFQKPEY